MKKLVLVFSLYCITPSLFTQLISPNLIGGNAWLPGELGGNFEAIMVDRLGAASANDNHADMKIVRLGGNYYNNIDLPTSKQVFTSLGRVVREAGAEPLVQVPHRFSYEEARELIRYLNDEQGLRVQYWSIGNEPRLGKNPGIRTNRNPPGTVSILIQRPTC